MKEAKPEQSSVFSQVSLDAKLMDTRWGRYGLKFGKVKDVCRQYGIKYKVHKNCIEYYGPKTRMRFFIEKLHFSRKSYSNNSY